MKKLLNLYFKKTLEGFVSGLNISRSSRILKQSIFSFFNHYLGFENKSQFEILRIIITNSPYFEHIVKKAIKNFEPLRQERINRKFPKEFYDYSILEFEVFSEKAEIYDFKKYFQTPAYFVKDSNLELDFAQNYLEKNIDIEYWYKNGVSNKVYFGVEYESEGKSRTFYPDFIVKYKDGKIGIFDTKDGNTASSMETKLKSEALQKYIKKNNIKSTEGFSPLKFGGIIIKNKNNFYLQQKEVYNFINDNLAGWEKI
ncbi:MAG: hypothetical protein Q9M97_10545 [Candidatus Gracilibacteria bacterium]|nr:hypothetical protein [Candidatus Gracilibacteria bacterium]